MGQSLFVSFCSDDDKVNCDASLRQVSEGDLVRHENLGGKETPVCLKGMKLLKMGGGFFVFQTLILYHVKSWYKAESSTQTLSKSSLNSTLSSSENQLLIFMTSKKEKVNFAKRYDKRQ